MYLSIGQAHILDHLLYVLSIVSLTRNLMRYL